MIDPRGRRNAYVAAALIGLVGIAGLAGAGAQATAGNNSHTPKKNALYTDCKGHGCSATVEFFTNSQSTAMMVDARTKCSTNFSQFVSEGGPDSIPIGKDGSFSGTSNYDSTFRGKRAYSVTAKGRAGTVPGSSGGSSGEDDGEGGSGHHTKPISFLKGKIRVTTPGGCDTGFKKFTAFFNKHHGTCFRIGVPSSHCQACLVRDTHLAALQGDVLAENIRQGTRIWSTDATGQRIPATVLEVRRTPVPSTHEMIRLTLADGRTVQTDPDQPTPDGTVVSSLQVGQAFDGSRVARVESVRYGGGFTIELLPSGPTQTYFANGILLKSGLAARG